MPTNTKARTFGGGLVIDDREPPHCFWIQRDEEQGAGYHLNHDQATALHEALGAALEAHNKWATRRKHALAIIIEDGTVLESTAGEQADLLDGAA